MVRQLPGRAELRVAGFCSWRFGLKAFRIWQSHGFSPLFLYAEHRAHSLAKATGGTAGAKLTEHPAAKKHKHSRPVPKSKLVVLLKYLAKAHWLRPPVCVKCCIFVGQVRTCVYYFVLMGSHSFIWMNRHLLVQICNYTVKIYCVWSEYMHLNTSSQYCFRKVCMYYAFGMLLPAYLSSRLYVCMYKCTHKHPKHLSHGCTNTDSEAVRRQRLGSDSYCMHVNVTPQMGWVYLGGQSGR